MPFYLKVIPLAFLMPITAIAQTESCGSVSNFSQIVSCAEKKSPEVQQALSVLNEKKAFVDVADQLINPELSATSVYGSAKSQNISETDVSLAFPIELGGKRAARKDFAQKDFSRSEADLYKTRAEVRKEVTLKIFRLRQVLDELDLVKESLETFSKLVKQYESRPTLSPEQEISLTVFRMAKGDYGLRQIEYEDELSQLEVFFQVSTGLPLAEIKKSLPQKIKKWGSVDTGSTTIEKSPALLVLQSEIEMAKAELNKAKGETWGTMSIGPSAKLTKDGNDNTQQYGLNLSLPIPVLSLNQGGRAAASASVRSAELRKELMAISLTNERTRLAKIYGRSVSGLDEIPNGRSLEEKHKKVERLFEKGIVPSSLVIEAHRTMVDFEKNRNERELKAIDSYLTIQFIDGKNVELIP